MITIENIEGINGAWNIEGKDIFIRKVDSVWNWNKTKGWGVGNSYTFEVWVPEQHSAWLVLNRITQWPTKVEVYWVDYGFPENEIGDVFTIEKNLLETRGSLKEYIGYRYRRRTRIGGIVNVGNRPTDLY